MYSCDPDWLVARAKLEDRWREAEQARLRRRTGGAATPHAPAWLWRLARLAGWAAPTTGGPLQG